MNDTPYNEREHRRQLAIDSVTSRCVEDILKNRTRHEVIIEAIVRKAVSDAYLFGGTDSWFGIHPTATVATVLDCSPQYLRRLAKRLDVGAVFGRERLFRDEDVQTLRRYMATDQRRKSDAT